MGMPWRDIVCIGKPVVRTQTTKANVVSWLGGALRIAECYVGGLEDVVRKVEALPDGTILNGLFILDHGNATNLWVGDEDVGRDTLDTMNYRTLLRRMRPRFAVDDGFVHLMQCEAGRHETALKVFAAETGVRCYGGTGYQHVFGFNTGTYRVADRHGLIRDGVRPRPWGAGG